MYSCQHRIAVRLTLRSLQVISCMQTRASDADVMRLITSTVRTVGSEHRYSDSGRTPGRWRGMPPRCGPAGC